MLKMYRVCLAIALMAFSGVAMADQDADVAELTLLAHSVSEGINARSYEDVTAAFAHPSALIYGTINGLVQNDYTVALNTAEGLGAFARDFDGTVEQRFSKVEVELTGPGRAVVETYYEALINGVGSHQGEEIYSAVKTKTGWKFISLMFSMEAFDVESDQE